jgi:hypothetical protein
MLTHIMLLQVVLQALENAVDMLPELELCFNLEGSGCKSSNDYPSVQHKTKSHSSSTCEGPSDLPVDSGIQRMAADLERDRSDAGQISADDPHERHQ